MQQIWRKSLEQIILFFHKNLAENKYKISRSYKDMLFKWFDKAS